MENSEQGKTEQPAGRYVSRLTKNTFAMILAGGRGSRLGPLTDWRAKPAVPFGGKFRIIDFPLSNCINSGIRRIGVATQYKAHSLLQHLQRGWSFLAGQFKESIELMPAQQRQGESWYQGTADAVFQNIDIIRDYAPEYILVLAGDHIYKMDYGKMIAQHVQLQADMTVACLDVPLADAKAFGVMAVNDEQRVIEFAEKPSNPASIPSDPTRALASMGIYVFNAAFLYEQLKRDADEPKSSHDFGKDIIPYLVSRYRVFAHRFSDSFVSVDGNKIPYWRDVGTIDSYWEANMELCRVTPDLNMYDREWPIWTYQEQLPPAKFVFDDEERRGMAVDSLVSGGCIISGASIRRSLLFSDVRVSSYAEIEDSVILPDVHIGENARLRKVVIDKRARVPAGLEVGFDKENDKKRFHVTDNGVTLITAEMLGQEVHHVR
jgi:glucose-1-phosphate adenylyltransferase